MKHAMACNKPFGRVQSMLNGRAVSRATLLNVDGRQLQCLRAPRAACIEVEMHRMDSSHFLAPVKVCEGRRKSQAKSEAKRRNWADPAFRLKMTEARRRSPWRGWNKGLKMSESTRRKMSLAKLGRKCSKATIARMSVAKSGRSHDPSTIKKMVEAKRGQPLSAAHRAAISAGQKRRHAARRVLVAVEAAHRELAANNTVGTPIKLSSMLSLSNRQGAGLTIEELQDQYMFQLREFRSLQEELRPWMDAFLGQHGRRPTLDDALATNVKWIGIKFQQYLVHKQKLLAEIPAMRSELDRTKKAAKASSHLNSRNGACGEVMNANAAGISRVEASKRMDRAMQYRGRNLDSALEQAMGEHSAGTEAARSSVAAALESTAVTEGHAGSRSVNAASSDGAVVAALGAAAVSQGAQSRAQSGASSSGAGVDEALAKKAAVAPSRVKSALAKALQYKANRGSSEAAAAQGGGSRTAVRLVPVEGKVIDGVDFSKVDASTAQAGESQFIQRGSAPVTSYRQARLDADGDVQWAAAATSHAHEEAALRDRARGCDGGGSDEDDEFPPNLPAVAPGVEAPGDASRELVGAGVGLAMANASYLHEFARVSLNDAESSGDEAESRVRAPPVAPLILALRSKQAAATAALAHAAATAAMPPPEHSGLGRGGKRAAAAAAAAALEGVDVCKARDNAQQALREFEEARRCLREGIAQRTGSRGDSLLWA